MTLGSVRHYATALSVVVTHQRLPTVLLLRTHHKTPSRPSDAASILFFAPAKVPPASVLIHRTPPMGQAIKKAHTAPQAGWISPSSVPFADSSVGLHSVEITGETHLNRERALVKDFYL